MGNELQAQPGTMTAVIQVKRKETGQVEEHTLVFTPIEDQPKEDDHGGDAQRDPA